MQVSRSSWWVALVVLAVSVVGGHAEAQPYVYVLGRTPGSPWRNVLTVVDGATNTKGPRISLGASGGSILPQAMAMAPDGDRIYVVNEIDSTISVVSTATNAVVETWPTALVGTSPLAVAVSPDGQRRLCRRQQSAIHRHRRRVEVEGRHGAAQSRRHVRRGGVAGRGPRLHHGDRLRHPGGAEHGTVRRHRQVAA